MDLLSYVRRIAVADQPARREALLALLRELDSPFVHYRDQRAEHRPENIMVRLGGDGPRLVIGAHYDSVPGSTGANDDAAGVAVLLGLLGMYLRERPPVPVDIAFFDLEEVGLAGSRVYLERVGPDNILAMINLDVCGTGDTVLLGPRRHVEAGPLRSPIRTVVNGGAFRGEIIERMPPGDDRAFEQAGVAAISVAMLPHDDVQVLRDALAALRQGQRPAQMPAIAETFHNGSRDSIDVIEERSMQTMLEWVLRVVRQLG